MRLALIIPLLLATPAFGQFDRAAVEARLGAPRMGLSRPAVYQVAAPLAEPTAAELSIDGPTEGEVGQPLTLEIHGLALDLSKTVAELFAEVGKVPLNYGSRDGGKLTARSSLALDPLNQELRYEVTLTADAPGVYAVTLRDGDKELFHFLTIGKLTPPEPPEPPPSEKVTAVTYFYEKDQTAVPPAVGAAISQLNAQGIMANIVEQDTTDGTGAVPLQYKASLPAARAEGLPCLVVMAGDKVLRTVKNPTTVEQITEAVK